MGKTNNDSFVRTFSLKINSQTYRQFMWAFFFEKQLLGMFLETHGKLLQMILLLVKLLVTGCYLLKIIMGNTLIST